MQAARLPLREYLQIVRKEAMRALTRTAAALLARSVAPLIATSAASSSRPVSAYSSTNPSICDRAAFGYRWMPFHAPATASPPEVKVTGLSAVPLTVNFDASV